MLVQVQEEAIRGVENYANASGGEASDIAILPDCDLAFEWRPCGQACCDVAISFAGGAALIVRIDSRVQVPAASVKCIAALMNVLNQNGHSGSHRFDVHTGQISYIISSFADGCRVSDMAARFMKHAEHELQKLANVGHLLV